VGDKDRFGDDGVGLVVNRTGDGQDDDGQDDDTDEDRE